MALLGLHSTSQNEEKSHPARTRRGIFATNANPPKNLVPSSALCRTRNSLDPVAGNRSSKRREATGTGISLEGSHFRCLSKDRGRRGLNAGEPVNPLLPTTVKLVPVLFPAFFNIAHDRLILSITPQTVEVLISLEPRIIHISQFDASPEP